jgi:hypothetical protein
MKCSVRLVGVPLFSALLLCIPVSRLSAMALVPSAQSCTGKITLPPERIVDMSSEELLSLADDVVPSGESMAAELDRYQLSLKAFDHAREVPLILDGQVTNSILLLDSKRTEEHTWLVLFSALPDAVRTELRHQGIDLQWNGFILRVNDADASTPVRLALLGDHTGEYVFDAQQGRFKSLNLTGVSAAASSGCLECIKGIITSIACESIALGISCDTVVGCLGATLDLVLRATVQLITKEPCFNGSLVQCTGKCLVPISITPASNARLSPGVTTTVSAVIGGSVKQLGAWLVIVPKGGVPLPPLLALGARNPRTVNWKNPATGTYDIYAGNIPLPTSPLLFGSSVSSNVVVGTPPPSLATCYLDPTCHSGDRHQARDIVTNQCVPVTSCSGIWKCQGGAQGGSCGGGTQDCTFSPGCPQGVQDCFRGNCVSLSTCADRIKFQGYAVNPTLNQCSCDGRPPAAGPSCP